LVYFLEAAMKVVIGYDGSDHAKRALERAADFVSENDTVLIVGVVEAGRWAYSGGEHRHLDEAQRETNAQEATAFFAERSIKAEPVDAFGDAGAAIIDVARNADADLIVVGSRGRSPIERVLIGSVSDKVIHRAESDVLVVR
jgi:nucleotide-binding universal stress UspA family protein